MYIGPPEARGRADPRSAGAEGRAREGTARAVYALKVPYSMVISGSTFTIVEGAA